jgi:hypothetical protein
MAPKNGRGNDDNGWAFVPLGDDERRTILANVDALKELSN